MSLEALQTLLEFCLDLSSQERREDKLAAWKIRFSHTHVAEELLFVHGDEGLIVLLAGFRGWVGLRQLDRVLGHVADVWGF